MRKRIRSGKFRVSILLALMTTRFDTSSNSTSSSLLRRAKDNDPQAWERLCELYAPLVYRWARQLGLRGESIADVGQEVFQVVAQRLSSFRREQPGDSFRGWLWGVTHNKVREHHRRLPIGADAEGGTAALERIKEMPVEVSQDTADSEAAGDRGALIRATLEQLRAEFEPATWQAFWRSAVDEERTADIASELGMSAAAVRQAKYRVLRRLRTELDGML